MNNNLMISNSATDKKFDSERDNLYKNFQSKIIRNTCLNRTLVSFQASKQTRFSSWFKYREGFSEKLVTYIIETLKLQPGVMLDPFSGAGSSLFAASALGWKSIGIELLPVGVVATQARIKAHRVNLEKFNEIVSQIKKINFANYYEKHYAFNHLAITNGAFSPLQEEKLVGYISYCHNFITDEDTRTLMLYGAFCILEDISYTRKDGQYLRWDSRSGHSRGKTEFNKGEIFSFEDALYKKLEQFASDLNVSETQLNLFSDNFALNLISEKSQPNIHQGSCLEILPTLAARSIDFVMTSPPYVNRYDYTRTYALELAFLGCSEEKVKNLRQAMLSCTVENRDKNSYLEEIYKGIGRKEDFLKIDLTFKNQAALHEVLDILEIYKQQDKLNNSNITRMVHNYFYEMCFVIYELSRVLKPGGVVAMVNDNVRYAGEEIPVDLILSNIAESFGLTTRYIWTLERGKGNSSQQMGNHGRSELRKCVYIWEKQLP